VSCVRRDAFPSGESFGRVKYTSVEVYSEYRSVAGFAKRVDEVLQECNGSID
jgi:hypothetical protein